MAFTLRDTEQVSISAQALDAENNPADATVAFASSDESIIAIADNGDGSALLTASPADGGLGTATITATVTNSDGTILEGSIDIDVVASDAVVVNIATGTPEPKA